MFDLMTALGLKAVRACYSICGAGEPHVVREWNRSFVYVEQAATDVSMRSEVVPTDTNPCRSKKMSSIAAFGEVSDAHVF